MNVADPYGAYVESAWDLASIGIGATSLVYNLSEGNAKEAAWDALGIAVDLAAFSIACSWGRRGGDEDVPRLARRRAIRSNHCLGG